MAVLVAYASANGSTRGIAERIAMRLGEKGLQIVIRSVEDVEDVAEFEAAVVGSAIQDGAWLPSATDFAHRNLIPLSSRPVWLFSVGLVGANNSAFPRFIAAPLRTLRREPKEIAGLRKSMHAVDHAIFAGAIQADHWPRADRAIFKAMRGKYGDHRDWDDIDAWTDDIVAELPTLAPVPTAALTPQQLSAIA